MRSLILLKSHHWLGAVFARLIRYVGTYIYSPAPLKAHTGATCLFLFSTYFLPPSSLPHTQTPGSKKRDKKKKLPLAPPISKSCKALSPLSYRTQIELRRPTLPPIRRRYRFSLRNLHEIIHFRCRTQLGQRLHPTTR